MREFGNARDGIPWGWMLVIAVLAAVTDFALGSPVWNWLSESPLWAWLGDAFSKSDSDTMRNFATTVAVVVGLPMAFWRLSLTGRQAGAAERGLSDTRFQKASEMLSEDVLLKRVLGIQALESLAREDVESHHVPTLRTLCAFIQHPPHPEQDSIDGGSGSEEGEKRRCPPDTQNAVRAVSDIRTRTAAEGRTRKIDAGFRPNLKESSLVASNLAKLNLANVEFEGANLTEADLSGANLAGADMVGANLERADLFGADLAGVILSRTYLGGVKFKECNLAGVDFADADLTGADFADANLTGAIFGGANLAGAQLVLQTGLTQENLREAKPSEPPASLPDGLYWPFQQGSDGRWSRLDG